MESGEVLVQAGEDPNEPEYMVSLFLTADYSLNNIDTMPYWCEELLQSKGTAYFALAATVHVMDLTTFAKVECYQRYHKHCAQLKADQRAIITEIEQEDEELSEIWHRLEGWCLHEHIGHLQNCLNLCWEPEPFHGLHCNYSHQNHCRTGPGGPA